MGVFYLEFLCDRGSTLNGSALKGEHGVVALEDKKIRRDLMELGETYVEGLEACTISSKRLVVKVDELLCDGIDVCHGC